MLIKGLSSIQLLGRDNVSKSDNTKVRIKTAVAIHYFPTHALDVITLPLVSSHEATFLQQQTFVCKDQLNSFLPKDKKKVKGFIFAENTFLSHLSFFFRSCMRTFLGKSSLFSGFKRCQQGRIFFIPKRKINSLLS